MKYLAIFAFILVTGCLGGQSIVTQKSVNDDIDVNGSTEPIPSITDIGPQPPPITSTTSSPTTPPTTKPPTPNPITTVSPNTTSTTTSTTTPKTTTTTVSTTTPNITTPTPTISPTTPNVTTAVPPTTVKPIDPTTLAPEPHRRFDGPSFVGGIVLALGLVAIGFVAFKFYKARTESNYHTL